MQKKEKRYKYNVPVVNKLADKYGITRNYVRECLNRTRNGVMADTLNAEYKILSAEVNKALEITKPLLP